MFSEIPPETTNYMIGGYIVFFVVFTSYLASLVIRWTKLKREFNTLKELEKK